MVNAPAAAQSASARMNPSAGPISRIGSEKLPSALRASVGRAGSHAIGMRDPGPTEADSTSVMTVISAVVLDPCRASHRW